MFRLAHCYHCTLFLNFTILFWFRSASAIRHGAGCLFTFNNRFCCAGMEEWISAIYDAYFIHWECHVWQFAASVVAVASLALINDNIHSCLSDSVLSHVPLPPVFFSPVSLSNFLFLCRLPLVGCSRQALSAARPTFCPPDLRYWFFQGEFCHRRNWPCTDSNDRFYQIPISWRAGRNWSAPEQIWDPEQWTQFIQHAKIVFHLVYLSEFEYYCYW